MSSSDEPLPVHIAALFRAPGHLAHEQATPGWGVGRAGRRKDGTEVEFRIQPAGGLAQAIRFRAYGCPWTLATCEWLAGRLAGGTLRDGVPDGPLAWSQVLGIPPERLGRLLVVEDALLGAWYAATQQDLEKV